MNYDVPHTVILVHHPRVRLDFLRPARILGPGVFHFEGDVRYRLRTTTQRKIFDRGAAEVLYMAGDTLAVLEAMVKETMGLRDGPVRASRIVVLRRLLEIASKQAAAAGSRVGDFSAPVDNALLVAFQAEEAARIAKETMAAQAARFHAAPQGIPKENAPGAPLETATPDLLDTDGPPVDHAVHAQHSAAAKAARAAADHQDQAVRHARALKAGLPKQGDTEMEPHAATPESLNQGPPDDDADIDQGEGPAEPPPVVGAATEPIPAVTPEETAELIARAEAITAPVPVVPEEPKETTAEIMDDIDAMIAAKVARAAADEAIASTPSPAGEEVPAAPVPAPPVAPAETGPGPVEPAPQSAPAPNPGARSGKKKNRY